MHLSDHRLNQLDAAYVQGLDEGAVHAELLDTLREASGALLGHRHPQTRALAVELRNDWDEEVRGGMSVRRAFNKGR